MNDRSFDELTRSLGAATSRRQMLKIAFSGIVGGALGLRLRTAAAEDGDDSRRPTNAEYNAIASPCSDQVRKTCGTTTVEHLLDKLTVCLPVCTDPTSEPCNDCARPLVNAMISSWGSCILRACSQKRPDDGHSDSDNGAHRDEALLGRSDVLSAFSDTALPTVLLDARASAGATVSADPPATCSAANFRQCTQAATLVFQFQSLSAENVSNGGLDGPEQAFWTAQQQCANAYHCGSGNCMNCVNDVCINECGTTGTCVPGINPHGGAGCCPNDRTCAGKCCQPGECCSGGVCVASCPTGPGTCSTCKAGQCVSCGAAGLCCNGAGSCVAAQHCPGGCCTTGVCGCPFAHQCISTTGMCATCGPDTNPNGCCDTNGNPQPGNTPQACRGGGLVCDVCGPNQGCVNQQCVTICNATTCPNGCCDSSGVCQRGTTASACGLAGSACVPCTGLGTTCQNGQCLCLGGQAPVNGSCPCNPACTVTGTTCQNGKCLCSATGQPPANGQCPSSGVVGSWNWTDTMGGATYKGTAGFGLISGNTYDWTWIAGWHGTATVLGGSITIDASTSGYTAHYELTLSGDGKTISGTWSQNGGAQTGMTTATKNP